MLRWFKKKKKKPEFKELVEGLISIQLVPKYEHASKAFGTLMTNDLAAGYVFGFHDCLLQRMGICDPNSPNKAFEIIEDSYKNIFGEQAGYILFSKSISKQDESEFQRGRMEGGSELDEYLSSKTPALGLGRILILNLLSANDENPISKLQSIIKNWPDDQAEAAVRVVKCVLEGEGFEEYLGQLTISQIEVVNEILEDIDNKA